MARYRATVISTRSAEETFDYLADFSNAEEWDPGTATAERLDDGPVGLGSAFRLGVRVGARVTPLEYRIVAFDRPAPGRPAGRVGRRPFRGHGDRHPGGRRRLDPVLRGRSPPVGRPVGGQRHPARRVRPDRGPRRRRSTSPARGTARAHRAPAGRTAGGPRRRRRARGDAWSAASPRSARWCGPAPPAGPRPPRWPVGPCWSPAAPRDSDWPRRAAWPDWVPGWSSRPAAPSGPSGPPRRCDGRRRRPTSRTCWPTWASSARCGSWRRRSWPATTGSTSWCTTPGR